jgi:glycine/D-amino acid oxidase-like deaminating enzyme/nitrite reductase/ring-hydroxylating ferredoxin subunit
MTHSIWSMPENAARTLGGELDSDVIVVGGGISGLTAAYCLAREGCSPVIVDMREPGAGETQNTTAHLASVLDDRFVQLEKIHGEARSRLVYQSHAAAIDFIEATVKKWKIDCDFQRVNGHLFASLEQKDFLHQELEASRRAGHVHAEWMETTPLQGIEHFPCIRFPGQAQFEPGRYLQGLLRAIQSQQIPVYGGVRIISWKEEDGKVVLQAADGQELRCNKVVFACNEPFVRFRYFTQLSPYRTYVAAFEAYSDAPDALYWDMEDPYHYVRFAVDSAHGNERLLLVGGEDHKTGQSEHSAEAWEKLERWARHHFPYLGKMRAQWSGQVLETIDGLAYIGPDPGGSGRVYLITGDSGMGLTHGTLGGMLIADQIAGISNEWAEVYDPGRFRLRAAKEYLRENMNVARQYVKVVLPAAHSTGALPRGCGLVVQRGARKVARSITRDGMVHECSAICTHLNGVVQWNEAEQTWDCPCHGSRFTPDGEIIIGPATEPLENFLYPDAHRVKQETTGIG